MAQTKQAAKTAADQWGKMTLVREIITPEKAKEYLGGNEGNRRLRPTAVAAYAADMRSGRWNDSADIVTPIMISHEGRLIDGQHRLTAVVQSGVSVCMYVAHNVDDSVYRYLDAGVKRSVADQIDCADASLVAAIAARAFATENGDAPLASIMGGSFTNLDGGRKVTRAESIEYVNEHTEQLSIIAKQARGMKKSVGAGTPMIYGYFLWLIEWLGQDVFATEFCNDFCLIAPASKTVTAARSTIQRAGTSDHTTITSKWLLGTLLCAYDHFCEADDSVVMNKAQTYINKYDRLIKNKRKEKA